MSFEIRNRPNFSTRIIETTSFELETTSLGPKTRELPPVNIKESKNVNSFVQKIKFQKPENCSYTPFFYKQHFYKQLLAEIGKNRANAKQHPKGKYLLFENYSHSSLMLSSKNNRTYSK